MNFSEMYKNEMNDIRHNIQSDKKILDTITMDQQQGISNLSSGSRRRRLRLVPGIAAFACMTLIVMNFTAVTNYAENVFGQFGLSVKNEKMKLDDIEPVLFDLNTFMAGAEEELVDIDENSGVDETYYNTFNTYKEFKENTGMILSESDKIVFTGITTHISKTYKIGHLSMDVLVDGQRALMNGMFVIEGSAQTDFGYGDNDGKVTNVYKYAEGKKAYFVYNGTDAGEEKNQAVYFTEKGVMYQLFVRKNQQGTKLAKQIIDYMAE